MTTYAAIPTVYKGIQFRSRLEARYAAYFDLRGNEWAYEPVDLKGYIPDFLLEREVLVEVKPVMEIIGFVDACAKIDRSGWAEAAVVVGVDPSISVERLMHCHAVETVYHRKPDEAHRHTRLTIDGTWDWIAESFFPEDHRAAWVEAGNLVQYKSPRGR